MVFNKHLVSCLAICGAMSLTAPAHAAGSMGWVGFSAAPDSDYGYIGAVTALNKDLYRDGFLLRASAGYGSFSYDRLRNPAGGVDGNPAAGDVMVGYQKYFTTGSSFVKGGRATIYFGGDYQNIHLNKLDTANKARGSELAAKGQAELKLDLTNKFFASAEGSYSGAFDTYWSKGRIGYNFGKFSFGPEVGYLGNQAYDQQRYGAFIGGIKLMSNVQADIGGGYENTARRGKDGGYGDISVSCAF